MKLIRLGGCPGHWRKKILNIGSGVRGGGGSVAGARGGKQDYCRATGRPHATFKIIWDAHCCLSTNCSYYNMLCRGANICLQCRVDRQNPNFSIEG